MKNCDPDGITAEFNAGLAGDRAAYERALRDISFVVRSYVGKRLSPLGLDSDVEDVVQTVLIAVHEKRSTFEQAKPLMPWVYGISKYKLLQHLRAVGRRRAVIADIDLETTNGSGDVVADQDPAAQHDVERLMAQLSPEHRQALELTKLKGFSIKEAAARAGTSVSSMKVRVHRAMKRLQKRTEER